ncbi:MAG: HD domain-containing protein [Fimbriimonadaceae bacterium]
MPVPALLKRLADAVHDSPWHGKVYFVGGCVRDPLLGLPLSHDFDFMVEEDAIGLAEFLKKGELKELALTTYTAFGTGALLSGAASLEFSTKRSDSYDSDSRKPIIREASLLEDAERRDFTINALYLPLENWEALFDKTQLKECYLDPTKLGLTDLNNRILRTPRDPRLSFDEDPLRILRAVRFRQRFDLTYDPSIADAAKELTPRLSIVSRERIADEITKTLIGTNPGVALCDWDEFGILEQISPDLAAMSTCVMSPTSVGMTVLEHTARLLDKLENKNSVVRIAALLHDIGKVPTKQVIDGKVRFPLHESVGAEQSTKILRSLRFPTKDTTRIHHLVKGHMRLHGLSDMGKRAARRLIHDFGDDLDLLLDLIEADRASYRDGKPDHNFQTCKRAILEIRNQLSQPKFESPLSGEEIMQITGLEPGQKLGALKDKLTDAVIDGELEQGDKERATELLKEWAAQDS